MNVYPEIVEDDLDCPDEPAIADGVTKETQFGVWTQALRDAGAECRNKLRTLRGTVHSWPKEMMR